MTDDRTPRPPRPPKPGRARRRAIRAEQGANKTSYTAAARAVSQPGDRPPAIFDQDKGYDNWSWQELIRWLDQAEARLRHDDPYARAEAYAARARIYHQFYGQTTDPVYAAACARAAVMDEITAARIRFEHGIPTIFPATQVEALGLKTCQCGRPWQADPAGACEHCPKLLFGPTPRTAAEAQEMPEPQPVTTPRSGGPRQNWLPPAEG